MRNWTPAPWRYVETGLSDTDYCGSYAIMPPDWDGEMPNLEDPDEYWDGGWDALVSDQPYYNVAPDSKADAQLIALAPEMADALLNYSECQKNQTDECGVARNCHEAGECLYLWELEPITAKLRMIGNDSE
jgi:hypothetical protein